MLNASEHCPFCKRWRADEYIAKLGDVIVFEPLNPVTPGHLLFVPTDHIEWTYTMAGLAVESCGRGATFYARKHEIVEFNLIASCGEAATQSVPHIHLHLVPRRTNDGLHLPWTGQER